MSERNSVLLVVCGCGPNIAEQLDINALASRSAAYGGDVVACTHDMLCTPDGCAFLKERLQQVAPRAVVIAGCSPREHLGTFRKVCVEAGANPYTLAMVNLREQCAWVTADKVSATDKADQLLRGGVERARFLAPLQDQTVEALSSTLVLGSGIAGLSAAKLLADAGREVILVERDAALGGRVARLGELAPDGECASCMLEGLVDDVSHHERIEVFVGATVTRLAGSQGQFQATIRAEPRYVDLATCFGCPECVAACPVSGDSPAQEGTGRRKAIDFPYAGAVPNAPVITPELCLRFTKGTSGNGTRNECSACAAACPFGAVSLSAEPRVEVRAIGAVIVATGIDLGGSWRRRAVASAVPALPVYSAMSMERLLSASGPTGGQVVTVDGRVPIALAVLRCPEGTSCVPVEECGFWCGKATPKYLKALAARLPATQIFDLRWQACHVDAVGMNRGAPVPPGIVPVDLLPGDRVEVAWFGAEAAAEGARRAVIRVTQADQHVRAELVVDLVLALERTAGTPELPATFLAAGAQLTAGGLLKIPNPRIEPMGTTAGGIFVAGTASGIKDVMQCAADGAAAAGRVMATFVPGRQMSVEAERAEVDETRCGACKCCASACAFGALNFDETNGTSRVDERLCRGCGGCAARCPSLAITARGFSDAQLFAEIKGVLR